MFGLKRSEFKVVEVMGPGYTFQEALTEVENSSKGEAVEFDSMRYFAVVTKGGELATTFTIPPNEEIK